MSLHIKDGGSWRTVDQPFVNVGGTWKTVREVHIKHGGTWRNIHTTPYTEYNLGSYVLDLNLGYGDSSTYTIPTGQGIAYIWIYVEGQAGGGGGGVYTPSHWQCSGSNVNYSTTTVTANGGNGGLGGAITAIHRVMDGDYVDWSTSISGANGEGGSSHQLNVFPMGPLNSYPSPGTYTAGSGEDGFMTYLNIRGSGGTAKSQFWAAGGKGGTGATITLNSTCTNASHRGFNVSASNGAVVANGQTSNQISAGSW